MAVAAVEHHRREVMRLRRITRWAVTAALALSVAMVAATRLSSPTGFFLMAGAVWLFVGAVARCIAAASRNLLDPYRPREPWEPRNWYDHER